MNRWAEGDAREGRHAEACRARGCAMGCRCWCHGVLVHLDGCLRDDAPTTAELLARVAARRRMLDSD